MKKISILITFTVFYALPLITLAQEKLEEQISEISIVKSLEVDEPRKPFSQTFDMRIEQPLDHEKPEEGKFLQRVYLSHKGFDKPVVVILEGYTIFSTRESELAHVLDANQLIIEHRFFKDSRPDSIPWSYLTVKNAAADQHQIIQKFKEIYKGKWISTGISKGGQTTLFHRSLFPEDVDVSVPYVAPLNFSDEDERVYEFLDKVGTKECREKIHTFQEVLLKRKNEIFPIFDSIAESEGWEFVLGREKAYDVNVMEYEFAFWQWNAACSRIPDGTESPEYLYNYWTNIAGFSFIEESGIEPIRPFFYQAMTEIGMYGYEVEPFEEYLDDTTNIRFDFTMPKGVQYEYNPQTMKNVHDWFVEKGNNMLFIYGEYDAWSSTAVQESSKTNARVFFNPRGTHGTRISSFPKDMKKDIYSTLEKWLGIEIPKEDRY